MASPTFSKFFRPETPRRGQIADRDLDILDAVLRYRFCSASQLVRLVGGNEDVTHRRLRYLWECQLLNRWAFPGIRTHSEFFYYIDSHAAVTLLAERRGLEIHAEMLDEVSNNLEKDYGTAAYQGHHMQLGFLQHSLTISRLHFCIEMACRKSDGKVALQAWCQGAQLAGRKVEVPQVKSSREGNQYFWEESGENERLPVEPDAMFTLRFSDRPQESQLAHFFYEADRGTMNTTDMLKKFRAYYHFIKKQQRHKEAFGIHPVRAVLIETKDEARARKLMHLTHHPLVCGQNKRSGLFWFTISTMLAPNVQAGTALPRYLAEPEIIFDPIWALPDLTMLALDDIENSTSKTV